jgi:uncharacterized protein (TIGR03067 family)
MRVSFFALVMLALFGSCFVFGQEKSKKDDLVKQELKELEGIWYPTSMEQGGKKMDSSELIEFSGTKCIFTNETTGVKTEYSVTIDPTQTPRHMDLTDPKLKTTKLGVYELKEGTLKFALQTDKKGKRPKELGNKENKEEILCTLQKITAKQLADITDAKIKRCQLDIRILDLALKAYRLKEGEFPKELIVLSQGLNPYLEKMPLDPWKRMYQYDLEGKRNKGKNPDIWTVTPDKKIIGNWREEKK